MTDDALANEARQLLLDCLPGTSPIWLGGEERGEHRIDTFLLRQPSDDSVYAVLSLAIDGTFVPDVVSEYPHVPYATVHANAKPPRSGDIGVDATVATIHSPGATRGRFAQRGGVREAAVIAGHCVLFDWDTPWLATADRPRPLALLIGDAWTPTVSSLVAATARDFGRGYLAHHAAYGQGRREHDWAREPFFESGHREEKIAMIEAILDVADPADDALGSLAAGPVEDLISHELLDYITSSGERRTRWVPLLRGTYWHNEPPDLRTRLVELLGRPSPSVQT